MSYIVEVPSYPRCDFCGLQAKYDGATIFRAWAYMCVPCFAEYGIGLGLGKGQALIVKPTEVVSPMTTRRNW